MQNNNQQKPKHIRKLQGLDNLSLGISIVVAVALGVAIGIFLKSWSGYGWTLWLGVFWGIAAAILNIKKAYDRHKKELDKLADDPKYKYMAQHGYKDNNEDK